ncbi:hypothetical protein BKA69DRAFT_1062217 [Paraphysoderma sedebokerense]|nr:hypothetical protein BKA69DRAFT_1062217 [Paraphysoderma sedebokerense]
MLIPRSSYSILVSSLLLTFSLPAIFARDTVSSKTCSIQSDCESLNNELRDISTHGNGIYWCVQGTCRFVVGAAEPCTADVDCLSTHIAPNTTNSTAPNTFCAPQFCTASSTCDAAWSRFDIPLPSSQSCCRSELQNSQCVAAIRTGVNVCEAGQKCSGDDKEGVRNGVCEPVNGKRFIWIGVILQLIGGIIVNIGLNVQKYGIKRKERAIETERSRQHVSADINDPNNTAAPTHLNTDSADADASQIPATPPTSALGRLRQRFRRNRGSEGQALSPSRESDEAHEEEKGALTFGMTLGNPVGI